MEKPLRQKVEAVVLDKLVHSMRQTRSEQELANVLVTAVYHNKNNPMHGLSHTSLRRADLLVSAVEQQLFQSPAQFYEAIGRKFEAQKQVGNSFLKYLPGWLVHDIRLDTANGINDQLKDRAMGLKVLGLSYRSYDGVRHALFHDLDPISLRHNKHEVRFVLCTKHFSFHPASH